MRSLFGALAVVSVALGSASASTIYEFQTDSINQHQGIGEIESLRFAYGTNDTLSFSASLGASPTGVAADAAWFVLSPGLQPKKADDELAIMYLDYSSGDVFAYRYDGNNDDGNGREFSYRDDNSFIAHFENVLDITTVDDSTVVSFNDLDVSALTPGTFGSDWTGVSFAESIGVWLHFTAVDVFSVEDGKISDFAPTIQSWYDIEGHLTTVPEPAGLVALGVAGVLGAAVVRRRRRDKALAA